MTGGPAFRYEIDPEPPTLADGVGTGRFHGVIPIKLAGPPQAGISGRNFQQQESLEPFRGGCS